MNPADVIDEEDIEESMGDMSAFKRGRSSRVGSLNASLSKSAAFKNSPAPAGKKFELSIENTGNSRFASSRKRSLNNIGEDEETEVFKTVPKASTKTFEALKGQLDVKAEENDARDKRIKQESTGNEKVDKMKKAEAEKPKKEQPEVVRKEKKDKV